MLHCGGDHTKSTMKALTLDCCDWALAVKSVFISLCVNSFFVNLKVKCFPALRMI